MGAPGGLTGALDTLSGTVLGALPAAVAAASEGPAPQPLLTSELLPELAAMLSAAGGQTQPLPVAFCTKP